MRILAVSWAELSICECDWSQIMRNISMVPDKGHCLFVKECGVTMTIIHLFGSIHEWTLVKILRIISGVLNLWTQILLHNAHLSYAHNSSIWLWKGYKKTLGPFICSRYTYPGKYSRNKFSAHERSDCEHCEMFLGPLHSDLKSAHISVCAVWLIVYTLRNVWGHF